MFAWFLATFSWDGDGPRCMVSNWRPSHAGVSRNIPPGMGSTERDCWPVLKIFRRNRMRNTTKIVPEAKEHFGAAEKSLASLVEKEHQWLQELDYSMWFMRREIRTSLAPNWWLPLTKHLPTKNRQVLHRHWYRWYVYHSQSFWWFMTFFLTHIMNNHESPLITINELPYSSALSIGYPSLTIMKSVRYRNVFPAFRHLGARFRKWLPWSKQCSKTCCWLMVSWKIIFPSIIYIYIYMYIYI